MGVFVSFFALIMVVAVLFSERRRVNALRNKIGEELDRSGEREKQRLELQEQTNRLLQEILQELRSTK
jgi:hypothetical protein